MTNLGRIVAVAVATAAFGGAAAAQTDGSPRAGRCISSAGSASWMPYDASTLLVRSNNQFFVVKAKNCPGLRHILPQVNVVLPGGDQICGPRDARLYVSAPSVAGPAPCYMDSIEPISAEQAKAMEADMRNRR